MSTATLPHRPVRVVPGRRMTTGPVLAAVDDDDNAGTVLRHARVLADELGVVLRVAYVWSDCRPPDCPHHRRCHRDLDEANGLVMDLLGEHLTVDEARGVERDVVHAADPAQALLVLSEKASALVAGSSSRRPAAGSGLGDTAQVLSGRTACPLVLVPHHMLTATRIGW